jgi:hypothetical protein
MSQPRNIPTGANAQVPSPIGSGISAGWFVRIHGDEADLAALATHSPVGRFVVMREERFDDQQR